MSDTEPDTDFGMSVMMDPDSWEVTLRIERTGIVFKDLDAFEGMVDHLSTQASRIRKVEQRFRPINEDDADRAVDAWERALLGTAEGNQEDLEDLVENIGALRAIMGSRVDGQFSAMALVAIRCFLVGKGADQAVLDAETMTTFCELVEITRDRPDTKAGKEFCEWLKHG